MARTIKIVVENSETGEASLSVFRTGPDDGECRVRLGRNEFNNIHLPDERVSRWHGEIFFDESAIRFTDNGSSNGSVIGGVDAVPDEPVEFPEGATLAIGPFNLRWEEVASPAEHVEAVADALPPEAEGSPAPPAIPEEAVPVAIPEQAEAEVPELVAVPEPVPEPALVESVQVEPEPVHAEHVEAAAEDPGPPMDEATLARMSALADLVSERHGILLAEYLASQQMVADVIRQIADDSGIDDPAALRRCLGERFPFLGSSVLGQPAARYEPVGPAATSVSEPHPSPPAGIDGAAPEGAGSAPEVTPLSAITPVPVVGDGPEPSERDVAEVGSDDGIPRLLSAWLGWSPGHLDPDKAQIVLGRLTEAADLLGKLFVERCWFVEEFGSEYGILTKFHGERLRKLMSRGQKGKGGKDFISHAAERKAKTRELMAYLLDPAKEGRMADLDNAYKALAGHDKSMQKGMMFSSEGILLSLSPEAIREKVPDRMFGGADADRWREFERRFEALQVTKDAFVRRLFGAGFTSGYLEKATGGRGQGPGKAPSESSPTDGAPVRPGRETR